MGITSRSQKNAAIASLAHTAMPDEDALVCTIPLGFGQSNHIAAVSAPSRRFPGGLGSVARFLVFIPALILLGCSGGPAGVAPSVPSTIPIDITTTALPAGQVGLAYNAKLAANGGTEPYSWSIASGSLPAGLSLTSATGAISGTPTAAGNGGLTFQVQDSSNPAQSKSVGLNLEISPAPLGISTASLPSGTMGTAYSATLAASGGTAPLSWSITSGALPAGLTLDSATGAITGTPLVAVTATLTFQVRDSGSPVQSSSASLSLTISPIPLVIGTTSLPSGTAGTPYGATLAASGGTAPYNWSITNGSLPGGLLLAAATGVISGTPTAPLANGPITFTVQDSGTPTQSQSVNLTLTIAPAPLVITTASLPSGQVNHAYSTTLTASGGTAPFSWSITAGTLPNGLTLNVATGAITGTPTVTANSAISVLVQDTGQPKQSKSASLVLAISPAVLSISTSPKRAGLTVTQSVSLIATTNDSAGVSWSISPSGGSISPSTSLSGASVTLTAPSTAGVYTVTATSVTDATVKTSSSIGVTDLAGVYTYHNDLARDGANAQEYALTSANVKTGAFGKLFSCTVDGAIYAQPLWVANLAVNGAQRNVVFVATEHDSLYAFDADTSPCVQLWKVSLIDTSHGAAAGETTVPGGATGYLVGSGDGDLSPEVGITGTPVIDPLTNTLYVVSKSVNSARTTFYQRLHAINIVTGAEKAGSPVTISGTYPGSGAGGTTVTFAPRIENQRAGLAFSNGTVYVGWGSHEDQGNYHGWLISYVYNGSSFNRTGTYCVDPNTSSGGGIWMSGGAPAVDQNNNIYVMTSNGLFDATNASAPNNDLGDSFLKLTSGLGLSQYFTPSSQLLDYQHNGDFGSGGATIPGDLPATSPVRHLVIGGDKDGDLFVLNRDSLGGSGDAQAWQKIILGYRVFSTGAFWNQTYFIRGVLGPLVAYRLDASTAQLSYTGQSSAETFKWPGSTPSVSASGTSNGIVWDLDTSNYCTKESPACGPSVLHAHDAANVATELWNSAMVGSDAAGYAVKFAVPTIANGKVYVGTRGNNTGGVFGTTSISGELDVYGLKPN